ncbi:MAG: metallophosphoesterase [Bacteroidales bacterium]|nr:metallophosphoesterase [Bacteroidales bacterium]
MSKAFTTLFLLLLTTICTEAQDTLRIMSYNIRNCRGLDNIYDIQRTADVIRNSDADIIAIQEVDSVTRRSKGVDIADTLAILCKMHAYYSTAIEYDGGKYGVAILSRKKAIATYRAALPGREEKRTILIAEYPELTFACTHLSLNEEDRMASLEIIDSIAKEYKKPFIIAGDLNDTPQSPFIKELSRNWKIIAPNEEPTFPADKPNVTIDYIAAIKECERDIESVDSKVIEEPTVSDHRPIVTTIITKQE